ncbi:MAG: tRNA (guanosine(46)-N7)-methyltransferase TrmB [Gammaproteobacteria bacterium]|nr:tRNA (guanosine(46)-N7)-methyltransferase TrmB [Gammaproteobacteria bacterium]MDH5613788.1 tRNA (guanosine(46)-N7)-methyltransferase TrmB [Gammaproteobacteria bacterium]
MTDKIKRTIRSFVRREGRMTSSQKQALENLWPRFGIEPENGVIDFEILFGRNAPVVFEIGFGMGDSMANMALSYPENNYLGIDVHRPGVGNLLKKIEENNITNIRIMCSDAVEVLKNNIAAESLDAVYLFFPDPWPKKKHHKRRIVQPAFVQLIRSKLKNGGVFHLATDWENYAEHMVEVMQSAEGFENKGNESGFIERPDYRPLTKFENRGIKLGHGVWDILFEKKS